MIYLLIHRESGSHLCEMHTASRNTRNRETQHRGRGTVAEEGPSDTREVLLAVLPGTPLAVVLPSEACHCTYFKGTRSPKNTDFSKKIV